ncbi:flagellar biosynthetic protein FliO [Salipaludibacillus sp. HK11]|uniref:flagellar biosynthetic protein FliO n=1 Tax=Salipaludibacillus sp. HK11 TaxID=3394320 RepID=UPI0039FCE848
MKKIQRLVMIFILLSFFTMNNVYADDFGEGDRNVNQILDSFQDDLDDERQDLNSPDEDEDDQRSEEVEEDELQLGAATDQNLFFLILQMFLGLGAVLFVIYFLLKFVNKRAQSFNSHSTVQNIGGTGVGSKSSVQIVRVGKRVLVVGVGETVQLLKEIDNPQEIDDLMESFQGSQDFFEQPISRFTNWLQKKKTKQPNENEDAFRRLLNDEMKGVKRSQSKVHSAIEEKD